MHEVGIIQSTLQMAEKSARDSGATRIHELKMQIGAMSSVAAESLEFAFEVIRKGTMAEEARLVIEKVPLSAWCEPCGKEFQAEDYSLQCKDCGHVSNDIRHGRELALVSMEVS